MVMRIIRKRTQARYCLFENADWECKIRFLLTMLGTGKNQVRHEKLTDAEVLGHSGDEYHISW